LTFSVEIAHIRSYYGVEREFDRYYTRLKAQLRGAHNFDQQLPDGDLIKYMAEKAENRNNLWDNPDPEVPLATAHLYNRDQQDDDDSDEALITLEHLNCRFNTIEKVSGAAQHGGIN